MADVSNNLTQGAKITLSAYRHWDNVTPSSYLITSGTGQLVDIKGDATDLLRSAVPIDAYLSRGVRSITTDLGEHWLVYNKRVRGGNVVGGISAADQVGMKDPASLLYRELRKYGSTISSATDLKTTVLNNFMTGEIVVSDTGQLMAAEDSVPIRVAIEIPDSLLDGKEHTLRKGAHDYTFLSSTMPRGNSSLEVIAFDVISEDQVNQSLWFNLCVAAVAWLAVIFGYAFLGVRRRLREARSDNLLEISTRQLIAQGENSPVEFKSTLRQNLRSGSKDDFEIRLAVLKTIAAFLNTDGGTLLIGVADDRTICGIGPDHFENSDRALLFLSNLIADRIGVQGDRIRMRVELMDNHVEIIRVDCKRGPAPAFVRTEKGQAAFYVRSGPSTKELMVNEVHNYIRNHFEETR